MWERGAGIKLFFWLVWEELGRSFRETKLKKIKFLTR